MKDKVLSLLGLARRAGKLAIGNDSVLESIEKKEAKMIFAAGDLSVRTCKKIEAAAQEKEIPFLQTTISMDELGFAIGKRVGILSITEIGFANKIKQLCCDITQTHQETIE